MPQRRAGCLRGAGQHQRARQQRECAEHHPDRHRGRQRLPVVCRVVGHGDRAEQPGERGGGGHRAADREQQMGPAGGAGVPAAGVAQQRDGRDRDHKARQAGQLHAGR
jgi:hypothetical protein